MPGEYTVEKDGNAIRLTDTYTPQTTLGYHSELAVAQLRAKFLALWALDMDSAAKEENPAHKLAAFIKVLICKPDGTFMGQGIVFRKDYADHSKIIAARDAARHQLLEADKRRMQMLEHR